jgi:hypothetical protein
MDASEGVEVPVVGEPHIGQNRASSSSFAPHLRQ